MNPITSTQPLAGEDLERRLEELLRQDRFAPPAGFLATERVDEASLRAGPSLTARVSGLSRRAGLLGMCRSRRCSMSQTLRSISGLPTAS